MTKKINKKGFTLAFPVADKTQGHGWRILTALLLFVGLFGSIWSVFDFSGTGASLPLLLLCGGVYSVIACGLNGRWRLLYIAAVVVPVLIVIIAILYIGEGSNIVINQAMEAFENYLGRILPRYTVRENVNQELSAFLFLMLPAVGLGALCGKAATVGKLWNIIPALLIVVLWTSAVFLLAPLPPFCVAAVLLAVAAPHILWRTKTKDNGKTAIWLFGLVAVPILIATLFSFVIATGPGLAESTRLDLARDIHGLRYENCGHALPEGDFKKIEDFAVPSAELYFSAASEPNAWYLSGFVGEVYIGDGWTGLSPARRAEYAILFSWLHDRDFYAQNQYTQLSRVLGMEEESTTISVHNADTCTAYLYAPYEVADSKIDESGIGDKNLPATGLRGETDYTISVSNGFAIDSEILYTELARAYQNGDAQASDYLASENAYREFVYENYLEIPQESRTSIEQFLQGLDLPEGQVSFADSKLVVDAYLNTLAYQDNSESDLNGRDFLTSFLEGETIGGSFHFATAATLMFRYMGIPARYVEGYRLNDSAIQDAQNGDTIVLGTEDTWAWAEIYREGVGFVPFTISPANLPEDAPQNAPEESANEPEVENPETIIPPTVMMTWIALVVLLVLIVIFIVLAIRRAIKCYRLKKRFSVSRNAESVSRMTSYLIRVLSYAVTPYQNGSLSMLRSEVADKFGEDSGAEYMKVIGIQQAALFSGIDISLEERECVLAFLSGTIRQVLKQAKLFERFRLWWIICLPRL